MYKMLCFEVNSVFLHSHPVAESFEKEWNDIGLRWLLGFLRNIHGGVDAPGVADSHCAYLITLLVLTVMADEEEAGTMVLPPGSGGLEPPVRR